MVDNNLGQDHLEGPKDLDPNIADNKIIPFSPLSNADKNIFNSA